MEEERVKYTVPILLLILAAVAPTLAHAESWAKYQEDKCRLKYPISLFNQGGIDAENFQLFSGPDKDTYFRTIGLRNEEQLTPGEIRAEYIKEKGTTDLVYERTKRNFLVLSGYRGQNIFYTKIALSPDNQTICVLHISYPREAKRSFDAIVTRMSRSFTAEN
jgi:serine/threonine-protein kinase